MYCINSYIILIMLIIDGNGGEYGADGSEQGKKYCLYV